MRQGRVNGRVTRAAAAVVADTAEVAMGDAAAEAQAGVGGEVMTSDGAVVERVGYAPIIRMDEARREIELCATSEAVDSYGTIFDYAASRDAFARWIGNVREMHERKAVGSRVGVRFDDDARKVYVTIRVSRGAQDTWEKVLDGTLRGASIGASNVEWQPRVVTGGGQARTLQVARRYDLVELSLVDNPSNPDALGYTFVRDATPDLALLDRLDQGETQSLTTETTEHTVTKREVGVHFGSREPEHGGAGRVFAERPYDSPAPSISADVSPFVPSAPSAGISAPQSFSPHSSVLSAGSVAQSGSASGRLHEAARAVLLGCGCPICAAATAALDEGVVEGAGGGSRAGAERWIGLEQTQTGRLGEAALVRALGASLRASSERLERLDAGMGEVRDALREAMGEISGQVSQVSGQIAGEMASVTGELVRRLERLEAQPMAGGPAARPVEKSHALHARVGETPGQPSAEQQYRALEALAGRIADPQAQIALAAELIRMQREGVGV